MNKMSSNNNNSNNNDGKSNRARGTVCGACEESRRKYEHDYSHCKLCIIPSDKIHNCSIKQCPCQGEGYLFEVDHEHGKNKSHIHQIPYENKSVRVCLQRPKEAKKRITNLTTKLAGNQAAAISTTVMVQEALSIMRQKRDRDDLGDAEQEQESETKQQKTDHLHLSDDEIDVFTNTDQDDSQSDISSFCGLLDIDGEAISFLDEEFQNE